MSHPAIRPQGLEGEQPGSAPAAELPSVPGFELLREVGQGRMGVVYQARQRLHRRRVALKVVRDEAQATARDLTAFGAEARAAARLQHPNIVPIYEEGDAAGRPYLATEYVEGESLRQRLDRAPFSPAAAAEVVETLARALHYAHEHQVLHCDLHPGNVLVGADDTPRLTDFGLAVFLRGEHPGYAYPAHPGYAAPEQLRTDTPVGPAADVYGLGALLYALLTGRPPFLAATDEDTARLARSRPPVPPGRLQPGLPADLEFICLKCLNKRPAARYRTAGALADDLRRFREGKPVQSRPVGLLRRAGWWCRSNPAAAGVTAAVVLLLALALGLTARAYRHARDAYRRSEAGRQEALQREREMLAVEARIVAEREQALQQAGQAALGGQDTVRQLDEAKQQLKKERETLKATRRALDRGKLDLTTAKERMQSTEDARKEAQAGREDLTRRLIHQHVADGTRRMDAGDLSGALPRFTEALRLARSVFLPEDAHRLRLAAALAGCPRPVQAWLYDKNVRLVRLSPDGRRILAGGEDGKIAVRDLTTGKPVGDPLQHEEAVVYAAFSPDGARVATADAAGAVHVWDPDGGKEVCPAIQHEGPVLAVAFSPDGRRLLTTAYKSPMDLTEVQAHLWEASTGEAVGEALGSQLTTRPPEFSPDGHRLLTVCQDRCARVWDLRTGNQAGASLEHNAPVVSASFSPGGKHAVTASADGTARVWDAATGRPVTRPLRHGAPVSAASFSPGGRHVLTAGEDRSVRVWEAATGDPVGHALRHDAAVRHAEFSPDGRHVLTACEDGTVRVWESTPRGEGNASVPLSPSGDEPVATLRHGQVIRLAGFRAGGRQVLTFDDAGLMRVWDLSTGDSPAPPPPEETGLAFSADGRRAARVDGRTVRLLDGRTHKAVGAPLEHSDEVAAVAFSPDGKRLLTVCHKGDGSLVRVWDADTGKRVGEALELVRPVKQALFSPDGKRVVAVCQDKKVRVLDAATGEAVGASLDHKEDVVRALFGPAGMPGAPLLLTIDVEGTVRGWDAATGKPVGKAYGHDKGVNAVAFSPDGKRVATAGANGKARVWELATGEPVAGLMVHRAPVTGAAFSPDGKRVVTACADRTARVWDTETARALLPPLRHDTAVSVVAFSADGRWLVTAAGGRVRVWDAATAEAVSPAWKDGDAARPVYSVALARGRLVTAAGTPGDPRSRRERDFRPDGRPMQDLARLSEVLAGERPGAGGDFVPYDGKDLLAAWELLRGKYAADFKAPAERALAWERRGAAECEALGQWRGAVMHLDRLIEGPGAPPDLYARRGHAHAGLKQWDRALADYSKAVEADGGRWDYWAGRADAAAGLGRWDQAAADYTRALERHDRDAGLWARRGRAEAGRGKWDRAAADLGKAIQLGRHGADLWRQYAVALVQAGNRAGYRRACARFAQRPGPGEESARAVARVCTLAPDALADLRPLLRRAQRAVEADPRSAADLERLGALEYRAGQFEPALKHLQEAVRLRGEEPAPRAWLFLAMANQRLGHGPEAKKWLTRATGHKPAAAASWDERQEQQVLRREAEELLKTKP